ncbi:MAG: hypothetical protein K2I71_06580, partial [Helicobacter sp.]|nr:hypothetical protein [Helicobacter sp.]
YGGGNSSNFLKLGYPGLDIPLKDYQDFKKESIKRDSVIFLSIPKSPFLEILEPMIEATLEAGYRVVYKTHNGHLELREIEQSLVLKWEKYKNFIFYTQANLSLEELARSITIVEFRSSMLYTYPLITHKPALLLQPLEANIQDNFYEKRLHIKIFTKEELLQVIAKLEHNKGFRMQREDLIKDFITRDSYCYGNASIAIAKYIQEYFQIYID